MPRPASSPRTRDCRVGEHLGIDLRALAAFRIALGLLVIVDLAIRASAIETFYTDAGAFPRWVLYEQYPSLARLSAHTISGEAWVIALSFLVAGMLGGGLVVGYRSRPLAGVLFLFYVSLFARNPLVLHGGDGLLLTGLLLGTFLPLGVRWGVDATGGSRRVTSLASVTILLQLVLVYATNAIFKMRSTVWLEGRAIRHVLQLEQFSVALGPYLAELPTLAMLLTWTWMALLALSPLLILATGRRRSTVVLAFGGFHVGMLLTMRLGLFPLVVLALLLLYLPGSVWDALERRLPAIQVPPGFRDPLGTLTVPDSIRTHTRSLATGILVVLLVGSVLWPAGAVGAPVPSPDDGEYPYTLFAPNPTPASEWAVMSATDASGETVHPLDGWERSDRELDRQRDGPRGVLWGQYLREIRFGSEAERQAFAAYLCRVSEEHTDAPVATVSVDRVREPTDILGSERSVQPLLGQSCAE